MACLDLHYYVNVHSRVQRKNEKYNHSPITLNDLRPEDELSKSPTKSLESESKCRLLPYIATVYFCDNNYSQLLLTPLLVFSDHPEVSRKERLVQLCIDNIN